MKIILKSEDNIKIEAHKNILSEDLPLTFLVSASNIFLNDGSQYLANQELNNILLDYFDISYNIDELNQKK